MAIAVDASSSSSSFSTAPREGTGVVPQMAFDQDTKDLTSLFFRFLDGKTLRLTGLDPDADVRSVKRQLLQQYRRGATTTSTAKNPPERGAFFWNVGCDDLTLSWNGKPLDDYGLLSDYWGLLGSNGNRNGAPTVVVSSRRKGGCFMISFSILATLCAAVLGSPCTCGLSLFVVPFLLPLLFVLPLFCL